MRNIRFLILLLGLGLFQSCAKEVNDKEERLDEIELREGDLREHQECFTLVFPLEIILPDRTKVEVVNNEDLRKKLKRFFEANADVKERPSLSYPVEVTFRGDKSKIISSEEQMMKLKRYCKDKKWKEREVCFRLIHPLTYTMPDGTEVSGENDNEIKEKIKQWYEVNPDSKEKPELLYPIKVKTKSGEVVTVQNEEDMIKLKKRCEEK